MSVNGSQQARAMPSVALSDPPRRKFIVLSTYFVAAFAVFGFVTLQLAGLHDARRLTGNLLLLLGALVAHLLCRGGRVSASAHVLVWTAFASISVVAYATGGFRSPATNAYLAMVACAGWLLGIRYLIAATALAMAAVLVLFVLGLNGLVPVPAPTRPIVQFATTWSAIALGGLLFYFALREMHRSWLEEVGLRQSLQRANESLESKVARRTHELSQARDAAEQASQAKSAFLANISHEIRTPIHAVLGLSEVLQRETTAPQIRERLARMTQASTHLLTLVNNVLDISKIESGKFELDAVEMRVADVVTRVLSMLEEQAQRKGLALAAELDTDADRRVIGDPTRLAQVLLNFTANALKFTHSGGVTLRCRLLETDVTGVLYRFEVQDTGVGISAEDQAHIFEPFVQVDDSLTRKRSGSGIGLTINRSLVQAMRGELGVQSSQGRGSMFWFTVRLRQAPAASKAPLAEDVESTALEVGLRSALAGAKVLVVDDNEVNRIVARAQLSRVGLAPDLAEDGHQALGLARRAHYHLILMDIHMPVLDGIETTRQIRCIEGYGKTPIIAMTADVFNADRQRVLDAAMDDLLVKPVRTSELYEMLARWLMPESMRKPPPRGGPDSVRK